MSLRLSEHAPELGTYHIDAEFDDELSSAVVPVTLQWSLTDQDRAIVNGRSAVTVVAPATTTTITMAGTDLALIAGKSHRRFVVVKWTYNSSYGTGLESSEQASFIIDPMKA